MVVRAIVYSWSAGPYQLHVPENMEENITDSALLQNGMR